MATYQIPLPKHMICKGNLEENWKTFSEDWNDYLVATELSGKDKTIQVATLRTAMGIECRKRLKGLTLTDEQLKDPDTIIAKLKERFSPTRNVLYDRYLFFEAAQQASETIDQFLLRLTQLATPCKFEALEEQMILTRLVLGCRDQAARARLFRKSDIDLKTATEALQISESTNRQLKVVAGSEEKEINFARKKKTQYRPREGKKNYSSNTQRKTGSTGNAKKREEQPHRKTDDACFFCGGHHARGRDNCPAYDKKCSNYKRLHHFAKVCLQKKVRQIEEVRDEDDQSTTSFSDEDCFMIREIKQVGTVNSTGRKRRRWSVTLQLDGEDTSCRLDCGTDCNVMSYDTCCQILQDGEPKLKTSNSQLVFYDGACIIPIGKRTFSCKYKEHRLKLDFEIVEAHQQPLLSADTCDMLGLITVNVDNISSNEMTVENTVESYKDVFEGLGSLPGEYHIAIDKTVPPTKNQPRKVAVAIKPELKSKLQDLEERQIIAKVTEPTDWISNMVIVRKPGKLRICLDPKPLNKAIKRPHYMMPTIEDVLPKLAKARIFSVLDAKDGFWQVKLDKESSLLTTFGTPFGRYRWLRMPFGIATAPEEFQRRQHEIAEDLPGVEVIADDYLIYGSGSTD
ncbi:uncharacterized protein [Amphiura filiformis]|uniref:uncharacterized protein n=1 Tax=Amphiura filiformis TaxID=82378 RepID=UPI003B221AF5